MKNILTIDDDVVILETISAQLENMGFTPIKAYNGKMGLEMAETQTPDLIILDVNMPGISGFEVLKELRKKDDTKEIPVIMLTSVSERGQVLQARRYNVIDYVLKPHTIQSLTKRFHVAYEMKKKRLSKKKPGESKPILISRGGKKTIVTFRGNITGKTRDEAQKVLGPTFRQLSKHDSFILDLRAIPSLSSSDIFFFEKLLREYDEEKLYISAGTNLDFLQKNTLSFQKDRLFSSMGEVMSVIEDKVS